MGMGSTWGNIQSFFSTSLLGSLSHLTSLYLSFTLPLALWGRVFLYCCSAGASQPLLKSTAGRGTLQKGFNTPSMGLFEVGSSVGTCCLLGSLPPHCVAGWTCSFWPYLFFFTSKNIFTSEALKFLSHRQHKAKNLLKWRFIFLWITRLVQFLLTEVSEGELGLQGFTLGLFWMGREQDVSTVPGLGIDGIFHALCAGAKFGLIFWWEVLFSMSWAKASKLCNKTPLALL